MQKVSLLQVFMNEEYSVQWQIVLRPDGGKALGSTGGWPKVQWPVVLRLDGGKAFGLTGG